MPGSCCPATGIRVTIPCCATGTVTKWLSTTRRAKRPPRTPRSNVCGLTGEVIMAKRGVRKFTEWLYTEKEAHLKIKVEVNDRSISHDAVPDGEPDIVFQ